MGGTDRSDRRSEQPWVWTRGSGPLDELLSAEVPDGTGRAVRVVEVDEPVFVVGSTQPEPPPGRWRTVRRRSGGGGVLLVPGEVLWVDLILPRDDPWWDDDVGRAAHVVGAVWAAALARIGVDGVVHEGALRSTPWSALLCFAGLGPGEVTVAGRKVLGVAQRRTRAGACFQCAVPLVPPGQTSVAAAGLTGADATQAADHLATSAGAIAHPAMTVVDALRAALA